MDFHSLKRLDESYTWSEGSTLSAFVAVVFCKVLWKLPRPPRENPLGGRKPISVGAGQDEHQLSTH